MTAKRKRERQLDDDDGGVGFYGDGELWHRTRTIVRRGSYGPIFSAILKKPKFRQSQSLPVSMAAKSAPQTADVALLRKELSIFKSFGNDCPFICKCFGEEVTYTTDNTNRAIHNLLLEFSYRCLSDVIGDFRVKKIDDRLIREITRQILECVRFVHDRGYVHCDLSPEILMVFDGGDDDFVVKIGDFGMAKRAKERKKKVKLSAYAYKYTRRNLKYFAPEVVGDKVQEGPADIWAIGCIVIKMLTGKSMWEGKNDKEIEEILLRISKGIEGVKIPIGISEEAKGFLKGCLDRRASRRLTAEALLNHPFVASGLEEEC